MDSLRIGDADREAAVELLGEQYALGRLTREEFDERSDAVWSAKTEGDLAPIFADLPPRRSGPSSRGSAPHLRRWPIPLAPLVVLLVVLTVVTHVPFLLLVLVGLVCFGPWRHRGWAHRR